MAFKPHSSAKHKFYLNKAKVIYFLSDKYCEST